ncbi:hypothetical protein SVIO_083600 [Streptomyces violaceusniger]|uniref:Uncharacterized protein n=1 Tax=Streptomyces violaceusniger TaxID=68280 RepID=A0A4D4LGZ7_STRVO|nr:hypothetical protein SVIO_083600 [Streptomyces violaceusniger]
MAHRVHHENAHREHDDEQEVPEGASRSCASAHMHVVAPSVVASPSDTTEADRIMLCGSGTEVTY